MCWLDLPLLQHSVHGQAWNEGIDAKGRKMIILVLGTGRSGTSTVARILHEDFKVFMGGIWSRQADQFNLDGYYEDFEFGKLIDVMVSKKKTEIQYAEAEEQLMQLISMRCKNNRHWGIKANTLVWFLPYLLSKLPEDPCIIRTFRPTAPTAMSFHKVFNEPLKQCCAEVAIRNHMLDQLQVHIPMHEIDFSERKTDEQIQQELILNVGLTMPMV
jgi:hypothetical protein